MPTRRHFLQGLGAMGLGALAAPRLAHAALAGANYGCQSYKVLDIYLHGAVSHRETYWIEDDSVGAAPWREPADMASEDAAASGATRTLIGHAGDYGVSVGEGFHPLVAAGWGHRIRPMALRTSSPEVHRIAAGEAITGVGVGRPGFASIAARMQARWGADDPYAAMVVDALGVPAATEYAVSTGDLDPSAAPVVLPIGNDRFRDSLSRDDKARTDALRGFYEGRYADRLSHPGAGRVRSRAFDAYETSAWRLREWEGLRDRIAVVPTFEPEGDGRWADTVHGVQVATHLLGSGARHVTVLGGGINAFDTHTLGGPAYAGHAARHNITLWHICQELVAAIQASRIDPAELLVVFHSEFGRAILDNSGTEHWGRGYAGLLFGGPVVQSGVAGSIPLGASGLAQDGVVTNTGFTPLDLAAAVCLAGGIDPVQPGMFAADQLGTAWSGSPANADAARTFLGQDLLGVTDTSGCSIDDYWG